MRLGKRRPSWSTLAKAAFLAVALVFGGAFLAAHWGETKQAIQRLGPAPVLGSLAFAALAQIAAMLAWRLILIDLGSRLSYRESAQIFYVSQLGKYIPGSVWQLAALVELGRKREVPRQSLAVSGVLALLVSVVTAGVFGGALVVIGGVRDAGSWLWLAPVMLLVPVAVLHPRVAGPVLDWLLRVIRRPPLTPRWTERGILQVAAWQLITWLCYGLHCWVLVVALGAPAGSSFLLCVGGFALAYAAGTVFLPSPAGAGVREAVLGAVLAGLIGQGEVVVVVLLSRVLLAVLDVGFGAVAAAVVRRSVVTDPVLEPDD
ncbi:MAG TPA: lysylphosphatidylglycerol synthase transmembrane domain-containing protein [Jatrophihabitans sp.]|jgi:hypothetical protein